MIDLLDEDVDQICIIVCENDVFYDKLSQDFGLSNKHLRLDYQKRCLSGPWLSVLWYCFFKNSLVITEYGNFIPRLIALLSRSQLVSVIYGVVATNKLVKHKPFRTRNLLSTSLYADHYYVVRRRGTFKSLRLAHGSSKVSFISGKDIKLDCTRTVDTIIWISQCWHEDGFHEIESFQQNCINTLSEKFSLELVRHPRDIKGKYSGKYEQYDGILSFVDSIEKMGCPRLIIGIASSAMLELQDLGLNVVRVQNTDTARWASGLDDLCTIPVVNIDDLFERF